MDFWTFVLPNMANCCIEFTATLLFVSVFLTVRPPRRAYPLAAVLILGCSLIFTFIDSFLFSILPFNFLLIGLAISLAFRPVPFKETMLCALMAYMLLIFLQVLFLVVYPAHLMGTHAGNFLCNSSVLLVAVAFFITSKRPRFQEYYAKHRALIRTFFLVLCLPELLTAQFAAKELTSMSKIVTVCLLLLQLLYVTLLLLVVLQVLHKQDRRQFEDTAHHIDTLNRTLDDSRQNIHDFNKHIRYLQNTVTVHVQNGEYAALDEHVRSYCDELLERSEQEEAVLQLDDPVFRALLYGRRAEAKTRGIEFCIDAVTPSLPSFPLKNYQLVELFDNLMDNAFECVELLTDTRWIRLILSCEPLPSGRFRHTLCIQNPYETLDFSAIINGKTYTTKTGTHQGVGLRKVTRLVEETGGRLLFNHESQVFSVKVVYET